MLDELCSQFFFTFVAYGNVFRCVVVMQAVDIVLPAINYNIAIATLSIPITTALVTV